ncbi:MAG: SgcJ/EcaC family oxidoreductase [Chthoniobacterales bacterium]|jgi:uncharacterized protein (TIGR02246 family)
MKNNIISLLILPLAACCCYATSHAQTSDTEAEEAAIVKAAEHFVEAFHRADAKAVAACWTTDGDYVDERGKRFSGREAIENNFARFFATNKGLKIRIDMAALRFLKDDVALEEGTSTVLSPDGSAPSRARYSNILVKKDGQWLLSRVREAPDAGPSQYEFLSDLEWAIGEWMEDTQAAEAGHITFSWAPGQNFIVATRTINYKDVSLLQSTQWIAWDPAAKAIRSWNFMADGGFGESFWTKDGEVWSIKSEAVLADGSKVSSTMSITSVDVNTVKTKATKQTMNGKPMPDADEVTMKRRR